MLRQLIGVVIAVAIAAPPPTAVDSAFDAFWAAASPDEAARIVDRIVATRVSFDEAYTRLKEGRRYGRQPTGVVMKTLGAGGPADAYFALNVPDTYDPAHRYQVRFQLHGGVMMRQTNRPPNGGAIGGLAGAEQIYVVPYAWQDVPWWTTGQLENLTRMLDVAKRLYNVDENRVVVSGVSDGGTGAYYVGMRETTPFASFLPLNGFIMVLANSDLRVDGPLYPNNMRNKPWFAVNGGRDPLYPASRVDPYIAHLRHGGVSIDYHPQPNAGHNTAWWPQLKDTFERFVAEHPRNPLPDSVTWETADAASHNRAHWLVIDALARRTHDPELPDLNDYVGPPEADFGVRSSGNRINLVVRGSNAEQIGLRAGDALVRINDEPVRARVDLDEAFEELAPGTRITLLVARNNQPIELTGTYEPQMVTPLPKQMFDRTLPSGRVDVTRSGNTVRATTRGVAAFTLLVSPDQFDVGKPIVVFVNGRKAFDRKVQKDLRTLLKWAARDNDRTMLFAGEIHVGSQ